MRLTRNLLLAILAGAAILAILPAVEAKQGYDGPGSPVYGWLDSNGGDLEWSDFTNLDPAADPTVKVHTDPFCATSPTQFGFPFKFYGRTYVRGWVPGRAVLGMEELPCYNAYASSGWASYGYTQSWTQCFGGPSACYYWYDNACWSTQSSGWNCDWGYSSSYYNQGTLLSSYCYPGSLSQSIPSNAGANGFIAAAWSPSNPPGYCGNAGRIVSQTSGEPGKHVFTVQFQDLPIYYYGLPTNSEIKLFEEDGHIEVRVRHADAGYGWYGPIIGGIENALGTKGVSYHNSLTPLDNRLVIYFPMPKVTVKTDPEQVCIGRPATFTADVGAAKALGAVKGIKWNWGDGKTSLGNGAEHVYSKRENYTVVLKVTFEVGLEFDVPLKVRVYNCVSPIARFDAIVGDSSDMTPADASYDPDGPGSPPVESGRVLSWAWDFGDGSPIAYGQEPGTHYYQYGATYLVRLEVTDTEGFTDDFVQRVTVHGPPKYIGPEPEADAGPDQRATEGATVTLDGSGGDAHRATRLTWVQVGGPIVSLVNDDTATPSFTAPALEDGMPVQLTFALSLYDGHFNSRVDTVNVTVVSPPGRPVADAGRDQSVAQGAQVTLSALGSTDPDNDPLAYAWRQVDGPKVELSDAKAAVPTFTAPSGDGTLHLVFRLVASDGSLESAADDVHVYASPRTEQPPLVSFSVEKQGGIKPGLVMLKPDAPPTVARFLWDFGDGTAAMEGAAVPHTFEKTGTYKVTLHTLDAAGKVTGSVSQPVEVFVPAAQAAVPVAAEQASPGAGLLVLVVLVGLAAAIRRR